MQKIRRHPLLNDTYEAQYKVEVRLIPVGYRRSGGVDQLYPEELTDDAMYAEPKTVTLTLNSNFIDKANAAQITRYFEKQVGSLFSQILVGMSSKFSNRIMEDLLPALKEMLDKKVWKPEDVP